MRVALTGGIASGKSTVAALFAALGVPIIDLDDVAREVVEPGTALLAQVLVRFGPTVRSVDGTLDRRALREIVFHDTAARRDLEALLHPAIRARTEQRIAAIGGADASSPTVSSPYVIVVIPLLAETRSAAHYDRVLLVDCDESLQRKRLSERDGSNAASVEAALAAQTSRAARRAVATEVILNELGSADLTPQVEALHAQYLHWARPI